MSLPDCFPCELCCCSVAVRRASASCSYIYIASISSPSQENSASAVTEDNYAPEVTFFPFSCLLILCHGSVHKHVSAVCLFALRGNCRADPAPRVAQQRGFGQPWDALLERCDSFRGEELCYIIFIDAYGSWVLSGLWWLGNLALQAKAIWKSQSTQKCFLCLFQAWILLVPFAYFNLFPPVLPKKLYMNVFVWRGGWEDGRMDGGTSSELDSKEILW